MAKFYWQNSDFQCLLILNCNIQFNIQCFDSKIQPYGLIFRPQVEKKLWEILCLLKDKFIVPKQEKNEYLSLQNVTYRENINQDDPLLRPLRHFFLNLRPHLHNSFFLNLNFCFFTLGSIRFKNMCNLHNIKIYLHFCMIYPSLSRKTLLPIEEISL